jgi:hypothetical protein
MQAEVSSNVFTGPCPEEEDTETDTSQSRGSGVQRGRDEHMTTLKQILRNGNKHNYHFL